MVEIFRWLANRVSGAYGFKHTKVLLGGFTLKEQDVKKPKDLRCTHTKVRTLGIYNLRSKDVIMITQ